MRVIEAGDIVSVLLLNDKSFNAVVVSLPNSDFPYFSLQNITYQGENTWRKDIDSYCYISLFQRIEKQKGILKK